MRRLILSGVLTPDGKTTVKKRTKKELKKPSMYKVIMLNDNYTTMEFVTDILKNIFRKSAREATEIMLSIHNKGSGVAGIYAYDIALTKVKQVHDEAAKNGFPLKCILEKE
ncbi:MAG TPA: ATP-dependent Clp protease adapter ClpS [bacterium]|nr:ATP-dependent Clp protease adapter ClpS [bacterium]